MPNGLDEVTGRFIALSDSDRFEEARQLLASIRPHLHEAVFRHNLGVLAHRSGNLVEAIAELDRAAALAPDIPNVRWALALALLSSGEFERGWKEFEWRLKLPRGWARGFDQPQWSGGENLTGKTILLHVEGGLGDGLQFVRYVPMVRERGARIILECQSALLPLLSGVPGVAAAISRGQAIAPFDYHSPLQSLPLAFGTRLETIPANVPYLRAPADRVRVWGEKLGARQGFRVGLAWSGSAEPAGSRSRTLAIFAPLAEVAGVEYHSLQVGPEAAEPQPAGLTVTDHAADLVDFAETAALVNHLDLVISVDTSVAHLAGSLGRDVWVLVPRDSDFRWLRDRSSSPWYPTMRLFRQERKCKDWSDVIHDIVTALRQRTALGNE